MSQSLILPWPSRDLSPNASSPGNWRRKASAAKAYRKTCWALALEAKLTADWEGPIELRIGFHPPSNRNYDLDNAIASLKSGLDGLADALKVNDSRFKIVAFMGSKRPPGDVFVCLVEP